MYFSYLTLPAVPENFFLQCLEKTKLIDSDPTLDAINKYRGPENRATILPLNVNEWLRSNIYAKIFNDTEDVKNGLFNVTSYKDHWENKNWWGMHTKHIDIGRIYALNYYFQTGGKDTRIRWHEEKTIIAETDPIQCNRWCILKTDIYHSVKGIEPGNKRYFISIGINEFPTDKIKMLIDNTTVIFNNV